MAELVSQAFTSDISALTTSVSNGGSVTWSSSAGMDGDSGGVSITAGTVGTSTGQGYVTFTALGSGVAACRGGFWIDPNSLTMNTGNNHPTYLIWNGAGANAIFQIQLLKTSGGYSLRLQPVNDAGSPVSSADVAITDGPHWVEVVVVKETSDGAANGTCTVYIDNLSTPVLSATGIDNFNNFALVSRVSFGYNGGIDTGTSGSWYMDRMKFRNDTTQINPTDAAAPTVTNITTQSGYFGTQKTVACTIADTDSDIVRCDVSTDGTTLITLTASGSATVTNNGTTAPYVTGTHTDVVATLGNGIKFDGIRSGAELSHTETVTVLVTDDLDATGNDTFSLIWSVPTGVGTQTLHLTGTQAQINAALATVEITATALGTIQCLMYSVTSTPLSDTDIFNITAVTPTASSPLGSHTIMKRRRRGA